MVETISTMYIVLSLAGYVIRSLKISCADWLSFVTDYQPPPRPLSQDDITLFSSKDRGGLVETNSTIDHMCIIAEHTL